MGCPSRRRSSTHRIRAWRPGRSTTRCARRGRRARCSAKRSRADRVAITEESIVSDLRRLLPDDRVLWRDYDLMLYEYDGSIDKHRPSAVVFPLTTEEVSEVVRACHRCGVPY